MRVKYQKASFEVFDKYTPIEKLDYILDFLDHREPYIEGIEKMLERLGWDEHNRKISKELHIVIDKLMQDGYVLEKKMHKQYKSPIEGHFERDSTYFGYYISFEGRYFNYTGGYYQLQEDKILHRAHLKTEQRVSHRNETILIVGAVLGILWLLLQSFQWLHMYLAK